MKAYPAVKSVIFQKLISESFFPGPLQFWSRNHIPGKIDWCVYLVADTKVVFWLSYLENVERLVIVHFPSTTGIHLFCTFVDSTCPPPPHVSWPKIRSMSFPLNAATLNRGATSAPIPEDPMLTPTPNPRIPY